jgi:hypothetical protein
VIAWREDTRHHLLDLFVETAEREAARQPTLVAG